MVPEVASEPVTKKKKGLEAASSPELLYSRES
jgi:hypothetical protein